MLNSPSVAAVDLRPRSCNCAPGTQLGVKWGEERNVAHHGPSRTMCFACFVSSMAL